MNEIRRKRLESRIVELVSTLYFQELKNPDIGFCTFTKAQISDDSSYIRIFVSVYEDEEKQVKTIQALRKARHFIKKKLARALELRVFPELDFKLDESIAQSFETQKLLDDAEKRTAPES